MSFRIFRPYSTRVRTRRWVATVPLAEGEKTLTMNIYNSNFIGFEGPVLLAISDLDDDPCFSSTFNGCGRIQTVMKLRNCNIVNSVAAVDDGAMIWDDKMNVEKSLFANNSRAVVLEASIGTPFTFTGLSWDSNVFDVRNEIAVTDITISYGTGSTPTKEDVSGSTTTLVGSVQLTITVEDENGDPIQDVQTSIHQTDGTQLMNEDTTAGGVAAESYSGSTPQDIIIRCRKSEDTDNPRYKAFSTTGQIVAVAGFSLTVTLKPNPVLN